MEAQILSMTTALDEARTSLSAAEDALQAANNALIEHAANKALPEDTVTIEQLEATRRELAQITADLQTAHARLASSDDNAREELAMVRELHARELQEVREAREQLEEQHRSNVLQSAEAAKVQLEAARAEAEELRASLMEMRASAEKAVPVTTADEDTADLRKSIDAAIAPLKEELERSETQRLAAEDELHHILTAQAEAGDQSMQLHEASTKKIEELEAQHRREVQALQEMNMKLQVELANK